MDIHKKKTTLKGLGIEPFNAMSYMILDTLLKVSITSHTSNVGNEVMQVFDCSAHAQLSNGSTIYCDTCPFYIWWNKGLGSIKWLYQVTRQEEMREVGFEPPRSEDLEAEVFLEQ